MTRRILLLALAFVMLSASALADLPSPENAGTQMILGEMCEDYTVDVRIFYKTASGTELTGVTRALRVSQGESLIARALDELLKPAGGEDLLSAISGDVSVLGVEYSCGIATVNLAMDAAGLQSEQELLMMHAAICNTLTGIEGVSAVNLLINSRQESVFSLPLGASGATGVSAAILWAQYQAEEDFAARDALDSIERAAVLYFPSANGQWVIPELRDVAFSNDDYASVLLDELVYGTCNDGVCVDFLSGGVSISTGAPSIRVTDAGERVLDVYLTSALRDYMMLQGISEWQMAAAITLTMCSFIPELDAVCVMINDQPLTALNVRGNTCEFTDGLMRRADFAMYAGGIVDLYFSNGAGGLKTVKRAMSAKRSVSAYSLMLQLISGPSSGDPGVAPVMPAGVSADDILGIDICGGVVKVNMSFDFYRLCQMLDAESERLLVFSIVNTLCNLPEINSASILVEGERIETLANYIYLETELMPNPGIIAN